MEFLEQPSTPAVFLGWFLVGGAIFVFAPGLYYLVGLLPAITSAMGLGASLYARRTGRSAIGRD